MKNRLKVFIYALMLSFVLMTPAYASGTQFFTSVVDLPLIPEFVEVVDDSVVFDKPSGRIVETKAVGVISKEKAEDFYSQSLPQLGWESIGNNKYTREKELLELEFSSQVEKTIIHVTLKPIKG